MDMMCGRCGTIFSDEGNTRYESSTGFHWIECPNCTEDSDIEEAVQCSSCGKWIRKDDALDGMCKDCAEEWLEDTEAVRDYIAEECFDDFMDMLEHCFTKEWIVKILMSYLESEAQDFVADDLEDFVEWCNQKCMM